MKGASEDQQPYGNPCRRVQSPNDCQNGYILGSIQTATPTSLVADLHLRPSMLLPVACPSPAAQHSHADRVDWNGLDSNWIGLS